MKNIKLNETQKNDIRRAIENRLKEVPEGMHLKLDKDLLEDLLFYKTGPDTKIAIWTGPFLRKLDLSKVSFDGAIFDYDYYNGIFRYNSQALKLYLINSIGYSPEEVDKLCSHETPRLMDIIKKHIADFSNTNVNIDFTKCNKGTSKNIQKCNFSYVDLSASKISESGLTIKFCIFNEANLKGISLDYHQAIICDFTNSGINIIYPAAAKKTPGSKKDIYAPNPLANHKLRGCFLNGKPVLSKEAAEARKNQLQQEISEYIKQYFNMIETAEIVSANKTRK